MHVSWGDRDTNSEQNYLHFNLVVLPMKISLVTIIALKNLPLERTFIKKFRYTNQICNVLISKA